MAKNHGGYKYQTTEESTLSKHGGNSEEFKSMRNSLKLRIPAAWRMCSKPFFLGVNMIPKCPTLGGWISNGRPLWENLQLGDISWRLPHIFYKRGICLKLIDPTCPNIAKHCSVGSSLRWLWAPHLWILCRRGPAVPAVSGGLRRSPSLEVIHERTVPSLQTLRSPNDGTIFRFHGRFQWCSQRHSLLWFNYGLWVFKSADF